MKKNKAMRVAGAALVAALLTTCVIGGTFAKYTSSTTGNSTATVAKWSFKVNDTQIANTGIAPSINCLDLFKTIKDSDGTSEETDVTAKKIAPGTSGSIDVSVENDSEVTAKYTIAITETNASNVPILYSTDNSTWVDDPADLTALQDVQVAIGGTDSQTVYWKWVYENGADDADTTIGKTAQTTAPTVTVNATLTATQVD